MAEMSESKLQSDLYKWTDEDTLTLIRWRIKNEALFTGKRNAAIKGFQAFVEECGIPNVTAFYAKKKWENLKQKYKELRSPQVSIITEDGEVTSPSSWKWYAAMDEAVGGRPLVCSPALHDSSCQDAPGASPPSASCSQVSSRKRKGGPLPDLVDIIKEMEVRKVERREMEALAREERRWRELEEREERREQEALAREEKRWRELEEREERREREALAREERRWRELEEREERREREWRETDERRERQAQEREERRERETKAREERFLLLLEKVANKN